MIRIRGDEESGYEALVTCDQCQDSLVFQHADHGVWVGSHRQVRNYLTGHRGWSWDGGTGTFSCPAHTG